MASDGTDSPPQVNSNAVKQLAEAREKITEQLSRIIIGQQDVIEEILISIFSKGHCLLEGVPGLAKTLLVSTLAKTLNLSFNRIQFTPDLMPADITGTEIYRPETGSFVFQQGPIFHNLVLADEIRRVSSEPEADLKELFSRIIFNACVSNLDDHPRNHAVLAKDQHWRLSPAYDLTPMPSIAIDNRDLAMTCGLHGRAAKIANIVSGHGRFLLAKDEAEKIARDIKTIVGSEWDAHLRRAGVSDKDCAAIASAKLYAGLDYPIEGGGTHRD